MRKKSTHVTIVCGGFAIYSSLMDSVVCYIAQHVFPYQITARVHRSQSFGDDEHCSLFYRASCISWIDI